MKLPFMQCVHYNKLFMKEKLKPSSKFQCLTFRINPDKRLFLRYQAKGVTIKNKPKGTEEVATLNVLPINLSHDDFEINIAPDIPQIYQSKVKTITPNFVPGKKSSLHDKDDQRTLTVNHVVRVVIELQHPFDLPKLEDGLKRLEKSDPMIQYITEEPGEYVVSGTAPVVVFPESMPKEIKRSTHEKRRPGIKEDNYFIPKLKQKIENPVANCDHRISVNHTRRKKEGFLYSLRKEDVLLKTYHSNHFGPHRITNFKEGVMEQFSQFVQGLQQ
ncbi:transposon Ty3-G Gag-Pol polyprotein [Trichonephila clavipes]|uniref:Transposon Ty3-G Gag-Pol polyprotein n=1 Tax=Trichonephila clavipes TaxID=2585209 RepID=A0A8X6V8N3_TRICX|nr:transposon Ty3-G Gag-Pol polyprotein [Trichonephila clavipes]